MFLVIFKRKIFRKIFRVICAGSRYPRLIIKILLSLLTWYKIILQEIGPKLRFSIELINYTICLSIDSRSVQNEGRCREIREEIIFRGYYFPTWRRGAAVNNKTNERSESWQMRGEYHGIPNSVRARAAEDVGRSQVKYNGTTARRYLIAPSAGTTCLGWWIITLKDMQGVGKEWLIRKVET